MKDRATIVACLTGALLLGASVMSSVQAQAVQKPTLPKDEGEKQILEAIAHAREGQRYANVSEADGRLMRQLTEAVGAASSAVGLAVQASVPAAAATVGTLMRSRSF